jgi:hypothetical protein
MSTLEVSLDAGVLDVTVESMNEVRRAIALLFRPGDVVEVRVPKAGKQRIISGYFKDFDELARAVERLKDGRHPGVYWTANPVNPALLARADHKLKSFVENTTSDADIICRRWMLVDLDPRRPAGTSSSDVEHAAALELARQMRGELRDAGWPEPIFADSGNGAHLLYPVELPNNAETADLLKRCLRALAALFNTDIVAVDEGVYNASRIFKVYGTTARKGDSTEDRPHRVSRILEVPSSLTVVPINLLDQLAQQAPEKSAGRVVSIPERPERGAFDVERFLRQHGVDFRPPVTHEGGRKFVLEKCPWDPSHRAPDAAVFEGADGKLGFHCFHNGCQGYGWREFRSRLESCDPGSVLAEFAAPAASSATFGEMSSDGAASADSQRAGGARIGVEDNASSMFQRLAPYPEPLGEDAYYGIAGRFVRLVEPHTEADPSFMLVQFLISAGNVLGRQAFVWAGADQHYPNVFGCGVGPTSTGRKGSASGPIKLFFQDIDTDWVRSIQSGLSSGEGLISCVRDPIYRLEKVNQGKGKAAQFEEVLADQGVEDKRLLVLESEFFGPLQAMRRQGNTLSPVMRAAFDKGNLNTMVKNSPARATGAHISIVGNITKEELLRAMLVNEMDNGFANRFLWPCSRRSKCLPEGGHMREVIESEPFRELQKDFNRIHYAVKGAIGRNADASDIWGYDDKPDAGVYAELTKERHGMYGACTARAAALTLRVSLIYALLDGASEIRKEHLIAALEVWRYCDDSAKYIFGDALGDPTADEILRGLRAAPAGLTRTEITALFDRHKSVPEISRALMVLHNRGLARFESQKTRGRPVEKWYAVWQQTPPPKT